MTELQMRAAKPGDAAAIVGLFAGGFGPDLSRFLIYGCEGAAEYLRILLTSAGTVSESQYFVVEASDGIAGAIELRRRPGGLFLNYVAVHPAHRSSGVGTRLFLAALEMCGTRSGRIGLDVFHQNCGAQRWYARLGFEPGESADLVELLPAAEDGESAFAAGLPQSDLCQERFGFSSFELTTAMGTFRIGRIGAEWYRLTDPVAAGCGAVFSALNQLEPQRRIFAVVPPASISPAQIVSLLAKTHRMEAEISDIKCSLRHDCEESSTRV